MAAAASAAETDQRSFEETLLNFFLRKDYKYDDDTMKALDMDVSGLKESFSQEYWRKYDLLIEIKTEKLKKLEPSSRRATIHDNYSGTALNNIARMLPESLKYSFSPSRLETFKYRPFLSRSVLSMHHAVLNNIQERYYSGSEIELVTYSTFQFIKTGRQSRQSRHAIGLVIKFGLGKPVSVTTLSSYYLGKQPHYYKTIRKILRLYFLKVLGVKINDSDVHISSGYVRRVQDHDPFCSYWTIALIALYYTFNRSVSAPYKYFEQFDTRIEKYAELNRILKSLLEHGYETPKVEEPLGRMSPKLKNRRKPSYFRGKTGFYNKIDELRKSYKYGHIVRLLNQVEKEGHLSKKISKSEIQRLKAVYSRKQESYERSKHDRVTTRSQKSYANKMKRLAARRKEMAIRMKGSDRSYNVSVSDWMSLFGSMRLVDIAIPGTHNSGTGKLSCSSTSIIPIPSAIVCKLSKTQNGSIMRQLHHGIRYFDLRVSLVDGEFVTVHGMVGESIRSVLESVRKFLDGHRSEVVLLNFAHFNEMDRDAHQRFVHLVTEILGPKIFSSSSSVGVGDIKVKDMVGSSKPVLLLHSDVTKVDSKSRHLFWNSIENEWLKSNSADDMVKKITSLLAKKADDTPASKLHVTQCVFTPNVANYAIETLLGMASLEDEASEINPVVLDYLQTSGLISKVNIVEMDFSSESDLVQVCITETTRRSDALPI